MTKIVLYVTVCCALSNYNKNRSCFLDKSVKAIVWGRGVAFVFGVSKAHFVTHYRFYIVKHLILEMVFALS